MSKMHTVLHLVTDIPGMQKHDLHHVEKAMRDPVYVAEVTEALNVLAKKHAKALGMTDQFTITGDIHQVSHHD
jgi:hypothetical protein